MSSPRQLVITQPMHVDDETHQFGMNPGIYHQRQHIFLGIHL